MITPEEKKEMLTIFRKHYDNLKMRCDIDNATLMLVILPAMQEYKLNKPAVINLVCDHPGCERIKLEGGEEQCGKCWQYIE